MKRGSSYVFVVCIIIYLLRDISLLIDVYGGIKLHTKHYKESESAAKDADDTVCARGRGGRQRRKRGVAGKGGQRRRILRSFSPVYGSVIVVPCSTLMEGSFNLFTSLYL
jgi:hypothetical protein